MLDLIKTKGWGEKIYSQKELYHSVGFDRCVDIFQNNTMKAVWNHKIHDTFINGTCLTRNKALAYLLTSRSPVQFIFDDNIVRYNNRIIPVNAEFQMDKDTNDERYQKQHFYKNYYSRSNTRQTPWNEEFIVGDVKNLNKALKGIIFFEGIGGSCYNLNPSKKRELYHMTREYSKKYDIPFAVEKEYLRTLQEQIVNNIWDYYEDEDYSLPTP